MSSSVWTPSRTSNPPSSTTCPSFAGLVTLCLCVSRESFPGVDNSVAGLYEIGSLLHGLVTVLCRCLSKVESVIDATLDREIADKNLKFLSDRSIVLRKLEIKAKELSGTHDVALQCVLCPHAEQCPPSLCLRTIFPCLSTSPTHMHACSRLSSIAAIIDHALLSYERRQFINHLEKHRFVRVCTFSVYLIDKIKASDPKFRLDKACKLEGCIKLFRVCATSFSTLSDVLLSPLVC